jgi:hypothetical protein
MKKDWYIKNVDNLLDLKDNITESELLLLYSYININKDSLSPEQANALYDFLSIVDDKFLEDEQ